MNTDKRKKRSVVIDTNVFVSALNFGGLPDRVVVYCTTGATQLYVSAFILTEVEEVLARKFGWGIKEAKAAAEGIKRQAKFIRPTDRLAVIADEADNRILEAATACGADFLISGDSDLLELKVFNKIKVVNPADFLAEALKKD